MRPDLREHKKVNIHGLFSQTQRLKQHHFCETFFPEPPPPPGQVEIFSFFGFWNAPNAWANGAPGTVYLSITNIQDIQRSLPLYHHHLFLPTCMCFLYCSPSFWDFEGIKNHSWCIAGSLSLHFQSLCSAMPSLLKEAGKLTNIQILYFKRISVQILFSIHRALHIFGLGEGTRGNSYFNRILLNYPLFRLSLALPQTKHILVHIHNKTNCKVFFLKKSKQLFKGLFKLKTFMKIYW